MPKYYFSENYWKLAYFLLQMSTCNLELSDQNNITYQNTPANLLIIFSGENGSKLQLINHKELELDRLD